MSRYLDSLVDIAYSDVFFYLLYKALLVELPYNKLEYFINAKIAYKGVVIVAFNKLFIER